jgi:hypothetical protein
VAHHVEYFYQGFFAYDERVMGRTFVFRFHLHNTWTAKDYRMVRLHCHSRRMRLAGHVAHMRRRMHKRFRWESQKARDHEEDLDVGGRITFKRTLETG